MRSTRIALPRPMTLSAILAAFTLGLVAPAHAWDVAIGTNALDLALYVGSGSGTQPTWTTIDERVRASDVPGATVPINWVTQSWDPVFEQWPADILEATEGVTVSSIYNDDIAYEFWGSAEAFVFGTVGNGDASGAAFAYDFELIMEPFTTANVVLDEFESFVYMESEPADVGTAFAQAKLYRTDVDINDPGGANMPLASDFYTLQAGDPVIDTQPSFSSAFENFTSSPETYNLRFEASVSVLEVPEPAFGAGAMLGTMGLAAIARLRRRAA